MKMKRAQWASGMALIAILFSTSSAPSADAVSPPLSCAQGGVCNLNDTGPGGGKVVYVTNTAFACGPTLAATCNALEWGNVDRYLLGGSESSNFWLQQMTVSHTTDAIGASAQNTAIGTGYKNTLAWVQQNGVYNSVSNAYVAGYIRSLTIGGRSDWYLPSSSELEVLFDYISTFFPQAFDNTWYMESSTEVDASNYMARFFYPGVPIEPNAKSSGYNNGLAAIRAFAAGEIQLAPVFSLSRSTETGVAGTAISGYTVNSTGGPIANYSISPAISNGLSFSTTTGLISGRPIAAAAAQTYTITGTNTTSSSTATYRITVNAVPAPAIEYVPPTPVPYLKTLTNPQIHLVGDKFVCTAGTYNSGYTLDGVIQGSATALYTPASYTFNLLFNQVAQTALAVTAAKNSATWIVSSAPAGALVSCSVTVTANSLKNTDSSTANPASVSAALTTQSQSASAAESAYNAAVSANSKSYQKALVDNRATWRANVDKVRTAYFAELTRINGLPYSKANSDLKSAALKTYIAAQKKTAVDYKASGPAALVVRDSANKAALDTKTAAIVKANSVYGTFIESIGYGVLIP
jgi:hypothetical protein